MCSSDLVIEQDISEKQAKSIYLGIGSNLGNIEMNIEADVNHFK